MPLYDFECKCGNEFEKNVSFDNRNAVTCECGNIASLSVSKDKSPTIIFKGKWSREGF